MPETAGFFGTKRTYDPDIIDLRKYEADCLYYQANGGPMYPPPPIPGLLMAQWTIAEMEAMRANRDAADEIYERIKAGFD